jgi:hypothetical protein
MEIRRVLGEEHLDMLTSVVNLASTYYMEPGGNRYANGSELQPAIEPSSSFYRAGELMHSSYS